MSHFDMVNICHLFVIHITSFVSQIYVIKVPYLELIVAFKVSCKATKPYKQFDKEQIVQKKLPKLDILYTAKLNKFVL